jgi:hypothetical protein
MKYSAPSREIGEKYKLPFLYNDWSLTNHAEMQEKLLAKDVLFPMDLWAHIILIEPRFINLSTWWAMMGVLSQYNFDDIWYFCTVRHWERDPKIYVAQKKMGWGNNGWIMSPATLARVEQEMRVAA